MAKRSNGNHTNSQGMRNLRSAGWQAAKFTGKTADKATGAAEKAAVGLFRWVTTDHSGMGKALDNMPSMGFFNTAKYILNQFLIAVAGTIVTGVLVFVLIAYGIPFLIMGHL